MTPLNTIVAMLWILSGVGLTTLAAVCAVLMTASRR